MVFVCPKQNVCSWANNCIPTKWPHLEPLCMVQVPTRYSHAVPMDDTRAPGTRAVVPPASDWDWDGAEQAAMCTHPVSPKCPWSVIC